MTKYVYEGILSHPERRRFVQAFTIALMMWFGIVVWGLEGSRDEIHKPSTVKM